VVKGSGYRFSGFPEGQAPMVSLPALLFAEVLPHLEDLDEVKVVLHVLWRLASMRSTGAPWVTERELLGDAVLCVALDEEPQGGTECRLFDDQAGVARLQAALSNAIDHGVLLAAPWEDAEGVVEVRFFANSPQGRATVAALGRGVSPARVIVEERPTIFALYEEVIGPLTALLSEELMEAEQTYPAPWIEDAFREAARMNKRNWKYVLAILERWRREGRGEAGAHGIDRESDREAGRGDREAETRRYLEDAYDRLIKH
jgi:DNA replication protein